MTIDFTNSNKPEVLTDEDIKQKIAQIKENRERKKQGLPPLKFEQQQEEPQQEQEQVSEPPKISAKPGSTTTTNNYAYFQQQIQNQLSYFQAEKFSQVAQAARKEKHIIYKFADEKREPPKLGEKPTRKNLIPIDVYFNELDNEIHYKLDAMRAEVANLQYVKSLQTPSVDSDGVMSPPVLTKNDKNRTNVSDKVFATLSTEIDRLNKKLAEEMALWYYGIPSNLLPKLENTSLANALEAGLYREIYGLVNTSKNSAVY